VYLAAVLGVANAKVLPFDWRAQVAEFSETIEAYQAAAGALADLAPAAKASMGLSKALEQFYAAVEEGTLTPLQANAVIQRLARVLVPVNHTNQPRFRHDPALPVQPLPAIAVAQELSSHGPDTLGFAQTQMVRGVNRVAAALHDATRLVAGATQ
jgi:hypothetical protein